MSNINFNNTTNGQGNAICVATLTVNSVGGGPANDNFANAIAISAGQTLTGTNVNATAEAGETNPAGSSGTHSVWWNYQAAGSGAVTISTTGSDFDTTLGVYTGSAVNALTLVAANDDQDNASGILTSLVTFNATAGTTYRIQVNGFGTSTGSIQISVACSCGGGGPANDNFANATAITAGQTLAGTNVNATQEAGEPNPAGGSGTHSVWWRYQSAINGPVTISTAGSNYDTTLGVYTGTAANGLTLIADNDDQNTSGGIYTSIVTFNATAGTIYRIQVNGYNGASGTIQINVSGGSSGPVNDNFASATTILLGQTLAGSNVGGTQEAGEPNPAGVSGTHSVWWNFQPASSVRVKITTAGSGYDTTLGVYTGSAVSGLTLVADNDDENFPTITTSAVTFTANAGTTYRIQVNGFNGASGNIQLAVLPANLAHDFSGDGKSDILLRHSTGYISMWLMNGATVSSNLGVGGLDPSWTIVGTASNTVASSNIPGTGDFNGDGKSDILLRHSSGYVAMFLMNGATVTSNLGVGGLDPSWSIVGIGDFNGDGKSDILLRHTSGYMSVWLMNGATVTSNLGIGGLDPSWSIVGIGDFNGDGKSDILLRHTSGYMSVWLMNGATVTSNLGIGGLDPSGPSSAPATSTATVSPTSCCATAAAICRCG